MFFPGAGMRGQSSVRQVDLETGEVLRKAMLPHVDFGEGLASYGDRCPPLLII